METYPSFSASLSCFAQNGVHKTGELLDILKCPHTDPVAERFRPMPKTGVTAVQLLFGYFLFAMKIAILSFITEVAARLKIVWTLLCYRHVQGTSCSQSKNCDIYCVINVTCETQHASHLSLDSDDYTFIPSTHVVWLKMSGVTWVTLTSFVKQRPR